MADGAMYAVALGAAALVYAVHLVLFGLSLGAVLRQLDRPAGPAWVPVRRWIEVARAADAPVAPTAVARSVEALAGVLAAVALAALSTGVEAPRVAWVAPLLVGGLAGLVGWILWIQQAGWLGLRLRLPRSLTVLAAFLPPIWGFVAAPRAAREVKPLTGAIPVVAPEAPDPGPQSTESVPTVVLDAPHEAVDEPDAAVDAPDASVDVASVPLEALADDDAPYVPQVAAPPSPRSIFAPVTASIPQVSSGLESPPSESQAPVVPAGGSPEPLAPFASQRQPLAPPTVVSGEPQPPQPLQETPVTDPSEPDLPTPWTAGPQPGADDAAQAPAPGSATPPSSETPRVAPTQPVSPYSAPPEVTAAEGLATAPTPSLSERRSQQPDSAIGAPGSEESGAAWHGAFDDAAIAALLGGGFGEEDDLDETRVSPRRREPWELVTRDGIAYRLVDAVTIVGRIGGFPSADGAGRVDIADPTRTMSKTHARLVWIDGIWMVEDLGSTNGTLLIDGAGRETVVPPYAPTPITGRVMFGDFEMMLRRVGA
ncbi:FHA domain-containing protein [Demequina capsici]|uniref:FHA domain-containing protein n=1 Tax=Demequina capsici TaxID=3075620 RepID=A0AA96F9K9_9MICO|nr:FHA domain-containing protein [Demequina sp. OYTSA14]WNM24611.1 FHA domain-containing protein [Demequina sp. OYTSA14]